VKPLKTAKNPVLFIKDRVYKIETTPYEEAITHIHKAMIHLSAIISQTDDMSTDNICTNYENRLPKRHFETTTESNKKLKDAQNALRAEKDKPPKDGNPKDE